MQEMVEHMMIVPSMTYCYSNIADTKTGTKSTATVSSALRRTGLNFSKCHDRRSPASDFRSTDCQLLGGGKEHGTR